MDGDVADAVHLLVRQGVEHPDQQGAAAPVDDVLHLVPVEVVGGVLPLPDVQQFLGVGLGVQVLPGQIAVAQGDQRKAHPVKVPQAVVRDVPAQHIVPYLVIFMALMGPFLRGKAAEGGQGEPVFGQHTLHFPQGTVDFGSFHKHSSFQSSLFVF